MKNIALKYGIVIGIFMTVVLTIFCAIFPKLMTGFMPLTIVSGLTLGMMIYYHITNKNETKGAIQYHEAFIAAFIMGFVAIGITETASIVLKGAIFTEIPELEKKVAVDVWTDFIARAKVEKNDSGEEKYTLVQIKEFEKYRDDAQNAAYNPLSNIGNTILILFAKSGLVAAFLALLTSFFGFKKADES